MLLYLTLLPIGYVKYNNVTNCNLVNLSYDFFLWFFYIFHIAKKNTNTAPVQWNTTHVFRMLYLLHW